MCFAAWKVGKNVAIAFFYYAAIGYIKLEYFASPEYTRVFYDLFGK